MENLKSTNRIQEAIKSRFPEGFYIKPMKPFYKLISIKQKRWNQILRNERSVTIEELNKVSNFFNIPMNLLIDDSSMNPGNTNS